MAAHIVKLRRSPNVPPLPEWAQSTYGEALQELAVMVCADCPDSSSPERIDAILALLAWSKGRASVGAVAGGSTEEGRLELLQHAYGAS